MIAKKELIMFMPLIGGGGVEKNLYIITNYLASKFKCVKVCTISTDKKKNLIKNKIYKSKKIIQMYQILE